MIRLWTLVTEMKNSLAVLSVLTGTKGVFANPVLASGPKNIWFGAILVVAVFAPSAGFSERLDETVSANGHFDIAVHLDFATHETIASAMSSDTEGEEYGTDKREKGRTISVAASEGEYWGAYVNAYYKDYAVSWNFPSEKEALDAAISKCSQTIGIPCWPRRKVRAWWLPDYVTTFSTSVAKDELRVWPFDTEYGVHRFGDRLKARCILIYYGPTNKWYHFLLANSKDEATVKFKERRKKRLEEYPAYPTYVLVKTHCNKR